VDVTYGNISEEKAERMARAAGSMDSVAHEPGCTEPWISRLVSSFILASDARVVLETGSFKGATSVWIRGALAELGGDRVFHVCELDQSRGLDTYHRLYPNEGTWACPEMYVHKGDVLHYLKMTADRFDLAWVDDCHEKPHVTKELMLLMPKMNPGGLILLHDVFGVCDLKTVVHQFGGYSIDLPRLGPAGGLGIIQC
jgi:predicted O-methyltransferase YrrM